VLRAMRSLVGLVLLIWSGGRWMGSYIDPNTGGMLFQLLAVIFAFSSAIIFFFSRQIRMGLARISRLVRGLFSH
jgi:hypothetical protein